MKKKKKIIKVSLSVQLVLCVIFNFIVEKKKKTFVKRKKQKSYNSWDMWHLLKKI